MHGSFWTQTGRPSSRRLVEFAAAFVLAGAIAGPAGTAVAEGAGPTKSRPARKTPTPQLSPDLVAAKQAYEEALRAFNLGQWDEAVAGFQKSYKLSGDAALLFNVAQAQRQAGHVKEAIVAYKAFLREKPETPHREMIETKLKELESGADAKTAAKPTDSHGQPDRLTGIWEDPFVKPSTPPAETTQVAAPVAVPASAPPAATPAAAEPAAPVAPVATEPAAATGVVSPPSAAIQEPTRAHEPALDLRQKPVSQKDAAATESGSRWWLWTGIGAVVVAGVVTAVVLSTRGPQRDGTCPLGFDGCLQVGK